MKSFWWGGGGEYRYLKFKIFLSLGRIRFRVIQQIGALALCLQFAALLPQDHQPKLDYEEKARARAEAGGPKAVKQYQTKLAKDIK